MDLFWRGLWIGLAIAAPLGPIGVLVLRRTLAHGRAAGLASGLGAATVDAGFAAIAGFGLTLIADFLMEQASWMRFIGGLFLIGLGVQTFLARPTSLPTADDTQVKSRGGLVGMYFSALLLTLTNPLTILAFAAIAAGGGVLDVSSPLQTIAWVAGLFSGSALWWLILSQFTALFRPLLLEKEPLAGCRFLTWVNRAAGVALAGFGMATLLALARPDVSAGSTGLIMPGAKTIAVSLALASMNNSSHIFKKRIVHVRMD